VVRAGDRSRAAIASRRAAEIYGGSIIRTHLEDHPENYTRFLLLSPETAPPADANKISLVVMLSHQPGALYQALEPIARQKINLVKIESRPLVGHPWEYSFYLDLLGSPESPEMQTVLAALRNQTRELRILGSYVSAQPPVAGTSR